MERFKILVPVDFTPETDSAIRAAANLSVETPIEIVFVHVVSKSTEVENALIRLEQRVAQFNILLRGPYKSIVRVGGLFEQLSEAGQDNDVNLMLLGIHQSSTMTKMFGSNPLKVVGNCPFPIITVKKGEDFQPIQRIVITLDMVIKSVQIVRHVEKIAVLFNSKVYLVGGEQKDEALRKKSRIYFAIAEKSLIQAGVECESIMLDRKRFVQKLLDFCLEEKVNLIAATFYTDNETVLSIPFVQQLMDNKMGIPTMVIDGVPSSSASQLAGIIS